MTKFNVIIALLVTFSATISAQELNCRVYVDHSQIQTNGTSVFESLKDAITEYLNTSRRTDTNIASSEKINCTFFFTITAYSPPRISGDLQIQSSRPVYNSAYNTAILNFKDNKIDFEYNDGDPLIFSDNTFESNLTSILDFYSYLILALDFDSFSPHGGEPYYRKAQDIVYRAQSSGENGWKTFDDLRNRSAVISAFTDRATSVLRDLLYEYHRKGLDIMSVSPDKGRHAITASLGYLSKIHKSMPMSVGLEIFRNAKLDELINVYTRSTQDERDKAAYILEEIYPSETQRIANIRNGSND